MSQPNRFVPSPADRRAPALLILVGSAAAGWGLYTAPDRTWLVLLLNGYYLMSLGLSAMVFIASQRLVGARWSVGLRRVGEGLMSIVPAGVVLMLVLMIGRRSLYPWSRPHAFADEPATSGRALYLQSPFVLTRMTAVLLGWTFFAWLLRKASLAQDGDPRRGLEHHRRLDRYAAAFVVVFAPSFTVGAYDWILSLEPRWFSTIFAVYVFVGTFVQGVAAMTLATVTLRKRGFLEGIVGPSQLHDLGKMLFAFSTFWAYIWICQYMLVWYGNMPEEITHYVKRTSGPWLAVFALSFVMNWFVPFWALLSARAKKDMRVLQVVSLLLLLGHWLDLYLLIMPSQWPTPRLRLVEVAITGGYVGLAYLLFIRALGRAPLVPTCDPILLGEASREAHTAFPRVWSSEAPR